MSERPRKRRLSRRPQQQGRAFEELAFQQLSAAWKAIGLQIDAQRWRPAGGRQDGRDFDVELVSPTSGLSRLWAIECKSHRESMPDLHDLTLKFVELYTSERKIAGWIIYVPGQALPPRFCDVVGKLRDGGFTNGFVIDIWDSARPSLLQALSGLQDAPEQRQEFLRVWRSLDQQAERVMGADHSMESQQPVLQILVEQSLAEIKEGLKEMRFQRVARAAEMLRNPVLWRVLLDEQRYQVHSAEAVVLESNNQVAEALTALKECQALKLSQFCHTETDARIEVLAGRYAEAVALLNPVFEKNELTEQGRLTLSRALGNQNNITKALEAIAPLDSRRSWARRYMLFLGAHDYSRAVTLVKEASESDPWEWWLSARLLAMWLEKFGDGEIILRLFVPPPELEELRKLATAAVTAQPPKDAQEGGFLGFLRWATALLLEGIPSFEDINEKQWLALPLFDNPLETDPQSHFQAVLDVLKQGDRGKIATEVIALRKGRLDPLADHIEIVDFMRSNDYLSAIKCIHLKLKSAPPLLLPTLRQLLREALIGAARQTWATRTIVLGDYLRAPRDICMQAVHLLRSAGKEAEALELLEVRSQESDRPWWAIGAVSEFYAGLRNNPGVGLDHLMPHLAHLEVPTLLLVLGADLAIRIGDLSRCQEYLLRAIQRGIDPPARLRAATLALNVGLKDEAFLLAMDVHRDQRDNLDALTLLGSIVLADSDRTEPELVEKNTCVLLEHGGEQGWHVLSSAGFATCAPIPSGGQLEGALLGHAIGDTVVLQKFMGLPRNYIIRDIQSVRKRVLQHSFKSLSQSPESPVEAFSLEELPVLLAEQARLDRTDQAIQEFRRHQSLTVLRIFLRDSTWAAMHFARGHHWRRSLSARDASVGALKPDTSGSSRVVVGPFAPMSLKLLLEYGLWPLAGIVALRPQAVDNYLLKDPHNPNTHLRPPAGFMGALPSGQIVSQDIDLEEYEERKAQYAQVLSELRRGSVVGSVGAPERARLPIGLQKVPEDLRDSLALAVACDACLWIDDPGLVVGPDFRNLARVIDTAGLLHELERRNQCDPRQSLRARLVLRTQGYDYVTFDGRDLVSALSDEPLFAAALLRVYEDQQPLGQFLSHISYMLFCLAESGLSDLRAQLLVRAVIRLLSLASADPQTVAILRRRILLSSGGSAQSRARILAWLPL